MKEVGMVKGSKRRTVGGVGRWKGCGKYNFKLQIEPGQFHHT